MLQYESMIGHHEVRKLFSDFWQGKAHKEVKPAPLVLQNDATTLFTSSGMQPLVSYLAGEPHPLGKRLYNIQPGIRTGDIEEVGDNRHTTFFEMMGNWSMGDYFKKEQIAWNWEFLTNVVKLEVEKLHVSVFEGGFGVEKDTESADVWKKLGLPDDHIHYYGADKNWWSRSGPPQEMPIGEIGGPDSEVFYDFGTPHNPAFGPVCHPNCDCGRFFEICNSVFIQYRKNEKGELQELPQKNVDYGGGIERLLAALNDNSDVFISDVFRPIIDMVELTTQKKYEQNTAAMQVIADHMRASVFLIHEGVTPSNKEHGYILRRLLRRSAIKMYELHQDLSQIRDLKKIVEPAVDIFNNIYLKKSEVPHIEEIVENELNRFSATLDRGLREIEKRDHIDGNVAFDLFQSYGFPFELTQELAFKKGATLQKEDYDNARKQHQELSRSSSAGKFKGGLADTSDQVIKYHTATHLLHQALKDVFGAEVRQEGSNITQERLRFDVKLDHKPSEEEVMKVEYIINEKIKEALPVSFKIMPREEAEKIGAASFFKEKYGAEVKVYFIGDYSKEFCGGPHVENTKDIGPIEISRIKKIGADLIRIYVQSKK